MFFLYFTFNNKLDFLGVVYFGVNKIYFNTFSFTMWILWNSYILSNSKSEFSNGVKETQWIKTIASFGQEIQP